MTDRERAERYKMALEAIATMHVKWDSADRSDHDMQKIAKVALQTEPTVLTS